MITYESVKAAMESSKRCILLSNGLGKFACTDIEGSSFPDLKWFDYAEDAVGDFLHVAIAGYSFGPRPLGWAAEWWHGILGDKPGEWLRPLDPVDDQAKTASTVGD